jgi:hypothetical protein
MIKVLNSRSGLIFFYFLFFFISNSLFLKEDDDKIEDFEFEVVHSFH